MSKHSVETATRGRQWRRRAVWGAVIGAGVLTAAAIAEPPTADASVAYARTLVSWVGPNCIQTTGAAISDPYSVSLPTWQCSGSRTLEWTERRYSGQVIGVDPIMGDASLIVCSIMVNGVLFTDSATAGDGTDVSCLRTVL